MVKRALQSTAPQATAPQSTAPQATALQSTALQSTAPQSTAPQATAPQANAPQTTTPQAATGSQPAPNTTIKEAMATMSSPTASLEAKRQATVSLALKANPFSAPLMNADQAAGAMKQQFAKWEAQATTPQGRANYREAKELMAAIETKAKGVQKFVTNVVDSGIAKPVVGLAKFAKAVVTHPLDTGSAVWTGMKSAATSTFDALRSPVQTYNNAATNLSNFGDALARDPAGVGGAAIGNLASFVIPAAKVGTMARSAVAAKRAADVAKLAASKTFAGTKTAFANSNALRMVNGTKEVFVNKMAGVTPGQTFTAILDTRGKLVLGKDIVGKNDGKIGGKGSHLTLSDAVTTKMIKRPEAGGNSGVVTLSKNQPKLQAESGAVRFNADGSITVSGQHMQQVVPLSDKVTAAQVIAQKIRQIQPNVKVTVSPKPLRDL